MQMVTPAGPFIVAFNSGATCFASVSDSNSRISPFDLSQDWREPVTPPLTDAMIRIMPRSRRIADYGLHDSDSAADHGRLGKSEGYEISRI
jgi:hypothetical protein